MDKVKPGAKKRSITTEDTAGRTRKRALRTRRQLLRAALAVFCEKGVDATTIEEITERADLGKGTFYRHFTGKEDVMVALVADSVEQLVAFLDEPPPPPDLKAELRHLLDAHYRFFRDHADEFLLLFQGRLLLKLQRNDDSALEAPFLRYLDKIAARLGRFGQSVTPQKAGKLAYAAAGFVSGFFSFAMIGMAPEETEQSLGPLRQAFEAACLAFLDERGAVIAAPAALAPVNPNPKENH